LAGNSHSHKLGRNSEDIKRELSDIFRSVKDPRVSGLISIVKVDLSGDMSYCKVYISCLEGLETAKESVKGLKNAQGFIRRELGGRLSLRKVPELQFIPDDSIEAGARISKILDEVASAEKQE